jgi:ELWxxDGT repeat protein
MTKHLSGLLFASILVAGSPVCAQLPQRVSDLNSRRLDGDPHCLTSFNNKLYFSADNGTTGRELWSYDGSASQPVLVADLVPGSADGIQTFGAPWKTPTFPVLNGKMYFPGYTPTTPVKLRLFSYDGSNPPTATAAMPDSIIFGSSDMIAFGSKIFFAAGTATTGTELCAFDGVNSPTVYNINPNNSSSPNSFTVLNGKLYFVATGSASIGEELYVYDPATDQCSLVLDIYPGASGSYCRGFMVVGNKMYFAAIQPYIGYELWQTDGTNHLRLTDLAPAGLHGVLVPSAFYNGNILFGGTTDGSHVFPYKYEISSAQTSVVSNDTSIIGLYWAQEYKGNVYISSSKGTGPTGLGYELWKYDGTNLTMLPEIWPGQNSSNPYNFVVHNDYLYFVAQDSAHGINLYRLFDPTTVVNTRFDGEINVFPNPAQTQARLELTLKSTQQLSFSITDITGKGVYTTGIRHWNSGKSGINIPMQSFAAGSYSYQLLDSKGQRMASGILIKQ